jgi:multicomponent Na+:H+ antiporter subunit E
MTLPWGRVLLPVGLWMVLTGADPDGLAFGALAVGASVWLGLVIAPARGSAARPLALAALVPRFLWRSLLGGIDVAARALSPHMPLKPGWRHLGTRLPPGAARVAVGGEFSLMPGTLVAGSRDDTLLVHCLDTDMNVAEQVADEEQRIIAAGVHVQGTSGR